MPHFPVDAPIDRVIAALELLGFRRVCVAAYIALVRHNDDGTNTPMTLPNHRHLKSSTLRTAISQAGISREDFVRAYEAV